MNGTERGASLTSNIKTEVETHQRRKQKGDQNEWGRGNVRISRGVATPVLIEEACERWIRIPVPVSQATYRRRHRK